MGVAAGPGGAGGAAEVFHTAPTLSAPRRCSRWGTQAALSETAHTSAGAQLDSSSLAKRNSVGVWFCFFFFCCFLSFLVFCLFFGVFCFLKEKYSEDTRNRKKREGKKGRRH